MIVYRLCKEDEVKSILRNHNFLNLGYRFSCSNSNNHNYDSNKRYLHFFLNKDSIFYLRTLKDRYICTYDIPEEILNKYGGIGYYLDYFNYNKLQNIIEYAIESNEIKFEFLKLINYIKKDIDIEDFFFDKDMTEFVDVFYNKGK